MAVMGQDRLQSGRTLVSKMKPQIDFVRVCSRARRNAWAKLNNGNAEAKLPPQDHRHALHARIMAKLHARVLIVLSIRQNSVRSRNPHENQPD